MKDAPKELCVAGSPADRLPLAKLKMPPLEALSVYARCLETDGSKRRVPAFPSWLARHCTELALAKPRRDAPGVTESLCAPEDDAPHRKPARGGAGPKQGPDLNQGLERVILGPRDLAAPLPPPGLLSALGRHQEGPRGAARQEAPPFRRGRSGASLACGILCEGCSRIQGLARGGYHCPLARCDEGRRVPSRVPRRPEASAPVPTRVCGVRDRGEDGGGVLDTAQEADRRHRSARGRGSPQRRLTLSALHAGLFPSVACRVIHLLSPQSITR